MQTLTEKIYELSPPNELFDDTVIRNLFPDLSAGARRLLVYRAVRKGEILRLLPGKYCLAGKFKHTVPHPFVVAAFLHSPSHISLESALSYHNLIPEAVYQISSVTASRSRSFKTSMGFFTFQCVPVNNPRTGVRVEHIGKDSWVFIATPLRAIADLIYLRKEVKWELHGSSFLTQSMRIEKDDLMGADNFDEVIENFNNKRTTSYLMGLRKELDK